MAKFLCYIDKNDKENFVALDDISCVLAHKASNGKTESTIYLKSDPNIQLETKYAPIIIFNNDYIINIGKML